MYEEYSIQTTESDREVQLHRTYEGLVEQADRYRDEWRDDALIIQYIKAKND